MQIDSVASLPCSKFCFYKFNSVMAMALGFLLMERPQLFHFSSRALEKIYKVLHTKKAKTILSVQPGGREKSSFCYALKEQQEKSS